MTLPMDLDAGVDVSRSRRLAAAGRGRPGSARALGAGLALFSVLGSSGCVSVPKSAGFDDIRHGIRSRIGDASPAVQWRGVTVDDAAVDRAVRALLQHPLTADAAVQIALLNNRTLQATYEDLGVAQADLVQAGVVEEPRLLLRR